MKKSLWMVLTMVSLLGVSCASTTAGNASAGAAKTDNTAAAVSGKEIAPTADNVKIIGRTFERGGVRYLALSASAVEFTVEAKSLSVNLVGDYSAKPTRGTPAANWARYAIYVDGKQVVLGSMDKAKKTEVIFSGDEVRTATVKVIKLTESAQSIMGIKSFVADEDAKFAPTAAKDLRIEVIGDSITCGYGVEADGANNSFTTQTENATLAYAYLTCQALDADYSLVSYSGYGIYSGYSGDGQRNTLSLVPAIYGDTCYTYSQADMNKQKWDFSQFQPQLVVINLGTNDDSYCKTPALRAEYVKSYVNFLKVVHEKNPNAYIICSLGIMGDTLYHYVEEAVNTYKAESGNDRISAFHFRVQNGADGYGADWHPSEITQASRAEDLTAYIQSLLDNGTITK